MKKYLLLVLFTVCVSAGDGVEASGSNMNEEIYGSNTNDDVYLTRDDLTDEEKAMWDDALPITYGSQVNRA